MTIVSEIGVDMSRFETVKHFTPCLGLRPGTKIREEAGVRSRSGLPFAR